MVPRSCNAITTQTPRRSREPFMVLALVMDARRVRNNPLALRECGTIICPTGNLTATQSLNATMVYLQVHSLYSRIHKVPELELELEIVNCLFGPDAGKRDVACRVWPVLPLKRRVLLQELADGVLHGGGGGRPAGVHAGRGPARLPRGPLHGRRHQGQRAAGDDAHGG